MSEIEHRGSGAVRDSAIYVTYQVRKCLYYVPREPGVTIDEIANDVLRDWIIVNHSKIIKHVEEQEAADTAFKKSLNKVPFT